MYKLKYKGAASSSESFKFSNRRYDQNQVIPLLRTALETFTHEEINRTLRIVSFGSEDGYWLDIVQEFFVNNNIFHIYIGLEGGSKIGGSPKLILDHQEKYNRRVYYGLKSECTFEEAIRLQHPVVSKEISLPTIAHVYDGGILTKKVIDQLIDIINHFAVNSVMIFVTSRVKNIDKEEPLADKRYIHDSMMKSREWSWINRANLIFVAENNSTERTMLALLYKKIRT